MIPFVEAKLDARSCSLITSCVHFEAWILVTKFRFSYFNRSSFFFIYLLHFVNKHVYFLVVFDVKYCVCVCVCVLFLLALDIYISAFHLEGSNISCGK